MPILITPVQPTGVVGPGLPLQLQSDFVGPLSVDAGFQITISTDLEGVNVIWAQFFRSQQARRTVFPVTLDGGSVQIGQFMVNDGADVRVIAELEDPPGTPIDSGAITAPLNTQQGLANQAWLTQQAPGALTPEQAQQLQDTFNATVPATSMDQMGVQLLTPPGGASSLDIGLEGPVLGVIVRIDQLPDDLLPIRGDPDYWHQTLAQVSIYRSNDLWLRFPVHTQSRIFNLPGSDLAAGVAALPGGAWLLNMHLTLTTFPGVLATVELQTLP